ncbi:MAG: hypothetical protein Q4E54_06085 [Lachnospiraceae bacterium]|nr:hypothetical protein [Lachnospiraceae bacterium]
MELTNENEEYTKMSPEQKKRHLYEHQKDILDKFLKRGAISKQQYDKSLRDLTEKMGFRI